MNNHPARILLQSLVKPFYRENAGLFVFLFTIMFFIVSKVDGAGLYEYHYSLVTGMLQNNYFLLLVFFAWFLYVRKYVVFVSNLILSPHYAFIQIYNTLSNARRFWLLLIVEAWLLMPVLLYSLFIFFVGFKQHFYSSVLFVFAYLLLLCIAGGLWHLYLLTNPPATTFSLFKTVRGIYRLTASYQLILLRFVFSKQKMTWAGLKVFACGVLYLIARNNTPANYDVSMPFLFLNFGILANGILIFRIREFELVYLNFYSGLPVSSTKRFLQYSLVHVVLLIPEMMTLGILVPDHLHYTDAISFMLCSFSLLLLMNSITFVDDFKMMEYIKILLFIFCIQCVFIVTIGFAFLCLSFFMAAIVIFLCSYYKFEKTIGVES